MATKFVANPLNIFLAMEEVQPALLKIGEKVKSTASRLAPKRTGALSRSGVVRKVGRGGVRVAFTVRYAGFVEFGTVYMNAEPYLRPALDSVGYELVLGAA